MANRKNNHYMTYDKNAILYKGKILDIKEHNKECENGTFKNVFTVSINGQEKTCVLFERSCMEKGDLIDIKGRIKDDVFVCYSAMVMKNARIQNAP